MPSHAFRIAFFCLALACVGTIAHGGMTSFTERGRADFDTALPLLNPYGTWSNIDGVWAYTPLDHLAPYTDGRWIYTEYGWYWKGNRPHSWATEHYGYWKRGADKVWSWYPGPYWLPEAVEIRATATHIGWRSGAVDVDGNFIEAPIDRYTKTDEWTFVTLAQFANPITPSIAASPDVTRELLEASTDSRHTYLTYREIDRPGPHPADFVALCKDGGMFAPKTLEDVLAAQASAPKPAVPPPASAGGTNFTPRPMTGTNAPTLINTQVDPNADTRKVKYWITMSLPTYWTPVPADAKPEEIYLYRPDFYQDEDGINRRVSLWFNPKIRTSLKEVLGESPITKPSAATAPGTAPIPAERASAGPVKPHSPFQSPLDESFHPSASTPSSKNPAPSGTKAQDASGTNPAPVNSP
jgi:hypothetical protein